MIVYGRNPVREALRGKRSVSRVWATERAAREDWLRGANPEIVAEAELEEMCGSREHQGVCAEASEYPYADALDLLAADDALVVCLDQVQDPHNLGAVCRVAESAGVAGVVIGERRSAQVTPAVCKASAGAVEHLSVARVRNVADILAAATEAGCWCYGAAAEGGESYLQPDYSGGCVLVIGAEGRGLRPRVAAACDQLVALPLRGHVQSLNASAAAAALLYGILQKRTGA